MSENLRRLSGQHLRDLTGLEADHLDLAALHFDARACGAHGYAKLRTFHDRREIRRLDFEVWDILLLEVEKKNVPHFEVETPYLAAVVKGTQFRVSVSATGTRVEVQRGQVEVVGFKTGQIAQVLPGQAAQILGHGSQGLSLSGKGTFLPIEHG